MRNDMHKVIIDTHRRGGSWGKKNKGKNASIEELPNKEGMKERWYGGTKALGDRLNPLNRWLDKQVGRNWDDVYSEICKTNDKRSMSQSHLIDHIERHMVERHIEYINGKAYDKNGFSWGGKWSELSDGDLYVCPETGKLLKYKSKRSRPKFDINKIDRLVNQDDETECFVKIKGLWYFSDYSQNQHLEGYRNPYSGQIRYRYAYGNKYGGYDSLFNNSYYVMVHKEQLSKKELKKLRVLLDKMQKTYKKSVFYGNGLCVSDEWFDHIVGKRKGEPTRIAA